MMVVKKLVFLLIAMIDVILKTREIIECGYDGGNK